MSVFLKAEWRRDVSCLPFYINIYIYIYIIRVLYPRAGLSLQAQEPRLQFCWRQVFHCKLRNQGCNFTRDWIGVELPVAFCTPLSLFIIWTDLKRSVKITGASKWKWGEWIWLTGTSWRNRNSVQGLNISTTSEIRKSQSPFAPLFIVGAAIFTG